MKSLRLNAIRGLPALLAALAVVGFATAEGSGRFLCKEVSITTFEKLTGVLALKMIRF